VDRGGWGGRVGGQDEIEATPKKLLKDKGNAAERGWGGRGRGGRGRGQEKFKNGNFLLTSYLTSP